MSTLYKINRAIAKCFTVDGNIVDGETGESWTSSIWMTLRQAGKRKLITYAVSLKT